MWSYYEQNKKKIKFNNSFKIFVLMIYHCRSCCKPQKKIKWVLKVVEHLINCAKLEDIKSLLEQVEQEGMEKTREREKIIQMTLPPLCPFMSNLQFSLI